MDSKARRSEGSGRQGLNAIGALYLGEFIFGDMGKTCTGTRFGLAYLSRFLFRSVCIPGLYQIILYTRNWAIFLAFHFARAVAVPAFRARP